MKFLCQMGVDGFLKRYLKYLSSMSELGVGWFFIEGLHRAPTKGNKGCKEKKLKSDQVFIL